MSNSSQTVKVLKNLNIDGNFDIKKGYLHLGPTTQTNNNSQVYNISVGSVYEKGNISRSFINLSNIGTLIGAEIPDSTASTGKPPPPINNLITQLIPGMGTFGPFGSSFIGGPWTETQPTYSLQNILNTVNGSTNKYFCRALGLGLGNIINLSVSSVTKSGVHTTSFTEFLTQDDSLPRANIYSIPNWANLLPDIKVGNSLVYPNPYLDGFNFQKQFDVQFFNGTNSFPFMGWGGARTGNIDLVNQRLITDSLYNFPATEINLAKSYDSLGIIYAGQGTQYSSIFVEDNINDNQLLPRNTKKKNTFKIRTRNKISTTNSIPYQQGIGSYDFYTISIVYNSATSRIANSNSYDNIVSEGVQPGRNSAFAGVAISDYWSSNLNLKNINNGSLTPGDTRSVTNLKQTNTAHNAPLSYIPENSETGNTIFSLPWNTLFSYVGDTTSSPKNTRSQKCSILQEGMTSMVITGAYPLYNSQWNSVVRPSKVDPLSNKNFFTDCGDGNSQYYYNKESFWATDYLDPAIQEIQEISEQSIVQPNPPYRIKAATIVLFEGQRVKAGSYVYSSTTMTSTVIAPQFFPSSGKEIKLNAGEKDTLLGDIYSKFQGNQGGIIVMVSEDGKPPPIPPPGAQPIGIVMDEIIGFGTFDSYAAQSNNDTHIKPEIFVDSVTTNRIQARELLIKLLPMYSNYYLPGVPEIVSDFSTEYSQATPLTDYNDTTEEYRTLYPLFYRVKTNYAITTGIFNGISTNDQNWFYNESFLSKYGTTFKRPISDPALT
jgi:hypothetical protein